MGIMKHLGVNVTEQEVHEMVLEIDEDGSGTIDYDEFKAMVQKVGHCCVCSLAHRFAGTLHLIRSFAHPQAMADDPGGGSSALAMALVEHSFNAMGNEIAWKWQRGTMVQLRNGLWAPVFSQQDLEELVADGAMIPDCIQG